MQYEFAQPITAHAVSLVAAGRGVPFGRVEISDDGVNFRPLVETPGAEQYRAGFIKTYAFPATTAKFFRATFTAAAPTPAEEINQTVTLPAGQYSIAEFAVHTGARVDRWQEKAGFNFFYQYEVAPTPEVAASSAVPAADVVALTSKMDKDGTLKWDVPPGKWTILRMGYSLTGAKNRPAAPSATGFEVDKLNRKYVEEYFHGYFDPIAKELGPLVGKSLKNFMMDSFEGGMQNWTDDMIAQFQKRRGYDPTPYLPVLTGHIVGSSEISDRFLWDFRRTIADMMAECHYGTMDDMAHSVGMGIYGEANGVSMEFMEDTLLDKKQVEIPMGEFWVGKMHPDIEYYADVREGILGLRISTARISSAPNHSPAVVTRILSRLRSWAITGTPRASIASSSTPRLSSRWIPSPATRWSGRTSTATSPGPSNRRHICLIWPAASSCCNRDCSWRILRTCSMRARRRANRSGARACSRWRRMGMTMTASTRTRCSRACRLVPMGGS